MEAFEMQIESLNLQLLPNEREMRESLDELRDLLMYTALGIDPERADRLAQLCDLMVDVPAVLTEIKRARQQEERKANRLLARTYRDVVIVRLYENFEAEFPEDSKERILRRILELVDRLRFRPRSRWNLESCGERELAVWCLLQAEKRGSPVPGPRQMRTLVEQLSTKAMAQPTVSVPA